MGRYRETWKIGREKKEKGKRRKISHFPSLGEVEVWQPKKPLPFHFRLKTPLFITFRGNKSLPLSLWKRGASRRRSCLDSLALGRLGKKLPPGAEEKEGSSSSKIVGRGLNYFSRGENAGGPKRQSDNAGSTIFSPLFNRQLLFLRVTLMSKFPSRSKDAVED